MWTKSDVRQPHLSFPPFLHASMSTFCPKNSMLPPRLERKHMLLALGLAGLLLAASLLSVAHHHHDLDEHPDCSVCSFIHQANTTTGAGPFLLFLILPTLTFLLTFPDRSIPVSRPSLSFGSRAPPF